MKDKYILTTFPGFNQTTFIISVDEVIDNFWLNEIKSGRVKKENKEKFFYYLNNNISYKTIKENITKNYIINLNKNLKKEEIKQDIIFGGAKFSTNYNFEKDVVYFEIFNDQNLFWETIIKKMTIEKLHENIKKIKFNDMSTIKLSNNIEDWNLENINDLSQIQLSWIFGDFLNDRKNLLKDTFNETDDYVEFNIAETIASILSKAIEFSNT